MVCAWSENTHRGARPEAGRAPPCPWASGGAELPTCCTQLQGQQSVPRRSSPSQAGVWGPLLAMWSKGHVGTPRPPPDGHGAPGPRTVKSIEVTERQPGMGGSEAVGRGPGPGAQGLGTSAEGPTAAVTSPQRPLRTPGTGTRTAGRRHTRSPCAQSHPQTDTQNGRQPRENPPPPGVLCHWLQSHCPHPEAPHSWRAVVEGEESECHSA